MKEVELLCVRVGCTLFWPSAIGGSVRGTAGTIVRRDDLLINFGTQNQMHVFCAAPSGATVTAHENAAAEALYAGWEHRPEFVDKAAKPFEQAVKAAAPPKPTDATAPFQKRKKDSDEG